MRGSYARLLAMCLAVLLSGGLAKAASMATPVEWTTKWKVTPHTINSDTIGEGHIVLVDTSGGETPYIGLSTNSVVAQISTLITSDTITDPLQAVTFNNSSPITMTLTLTDVDAVNNGYANAVDTFTFTGKFSGSFALGTSNIDFDILDGDGNVVSDPSSVSITKQLGLNTYTVGFDFKGFYGAPDRPNADGVVVLSGSITSMIQVTPGELPGGGGPGEPKDVPEPSTMLLSCLGLSCLGAGAYRRWRKKADA